MANSEWTTSTLMALFVREMQWRDREQQWRDKFDTERDRRYAENDLEREKALKIKDEGDKAARAIKDESDKEAMRLAREIQVYKDEKANELREQISSERGLYATKEDLGNTAAKFEAVMQPVIEYVARNQGRGSGFASVWAWVVGAAGLVLVLVTLLQKWKP